MNLLDILYFFFVVVYSNFIASIRDPVVREKIKIDNWNNFGLIVERFEEFYFRNFPHKILETRDSFPTR